jgi:cell division protease FtsH
LNSTLKSLLFWMVLVVVGVLIWNFSTTFAGKSETPMPFSAFIKEVDAGNVLSVVMTGNEITGTHTGTAGNGTE